MENKKTEMLGVKTASSIITNPKKFRPKKEKRNDLASKMVESKTFFRELIKIDVNQMTDQEYRNHLQSCFINLSTCLAHIENLMYDNFDNPFEKN